MTEEASHESTKLQLRLHYDAHVDLQKRHTEGAVKLRRTAGELERSKREHEIVLSNVTAKHRRAMAPLVRLSLSPFNNTSYAHTRTRALPVAVSVSAPSDCSSICRLHCFVAPPTRSRTHTPPPALCSPPHATPLRRMER